MTWTLIWYRFLAFLLARYELIPHPKESPTPGAPYLSRWHFPAWMARRHGATYLFLHRFHTSDPDRGWHCHPWEWCESLILSGEYLQEILYPTGHGWRVLRARWYGPGDRNFLDETDHHAVRLLTPTVWTLFRAGTKHGRSWGFRDKAGRFTPANP